GSSHCHSGKRKASDVALEVERDCVGSGGPVAAASNGSQLENRERLSFISCCGWSPTPTQPRSGVNRMAVRLVPTLFEFRLSCGDRLSPPPLLELAVAGSLTGTSTVNRMKR